MTFLTTSTNATAQATLVKKDEKAPFAGALIEESTFKRIYADILEKDKYKEEFEKCQVATAQGAEKSESHEVVWLLGGVAIGLSAVLLIPLVQGK
jgi:hypothetical protein